VRQEQQTEVKMSRKIVLAALVALGTVGAAASSAKANCAYQSEADLVHKRVDEFVAEARKHGPTLYEGIVHMHFPEGSLFYGALPAQALLEDAFRLCFGEARHVDTVFDIFWNAEDMDRTMGPIQYDSVPDDKYKRINDEINRDYVRLAYTRTMSDKFWEWMGGDTKYPFIGDIYFDLHNRRTFTVDRCGKLPGPLHVQCIFQ
jgi:hypothetical protein